MEKEMEGNEWDGTWGLGLVGTRELKKKICGRTLYTRPPSPSLSFSLLACSHRHGCGWLWGGEGQRCAKHEKHAHKACFSCLKVGGGPGTRQTREARPMDVLFVLEAGVGPRMLEGWGGPRW